MPVTQATSNFGQHMLKPNGTAIICAQEGPHKRRWNATVGDPLYQLAAANPTYEAYIVCEDE